MAAKHFLTQLNAAQKNRSGKGRRWCYVAYDQLGSHLFPDLLDSPQGIGLIFIETSHKPNLRDYHQQKLALVATNMRHFALEQAQRGAFVVYHFSDKSYGQALAQLSAAMAAKAGQHLQIEAIEPAERELRQDLRRWVPQLSWQRHSGFLTEENDFKAIKGPPWRMDQFYARVRRRLNILMDGSRPVGGKFSHDADNRQPWSGTPPAPAPPTFEPDEITQEVVELVKKRFGHHMGVVRPELLPQSADDAQQIWRWAQKHCLRHFGPFEDAMSSRADVLFHTQLSCVLNLQRISAHQVLEDVVRLSGIPLSSREGFIRQLLGWREFVRHVHRTTDGLKNLEHQNFLHAKNKLPPAFWGRASGLGCLDKVVEQVMETGYSHHITRLMILSNIATLLGADPRQLTDWFWCAYVDAYDWVVEPNVLGMGTFALADAMMTKPYVSGAAYIDRMSDYCASCSFHPKKNCPITPMYWNFLGEQQKRLQSNKRMAIPLASLERRAEPKRMEDRLVTHWVRQVLGEGKRLSPKDRPSCDA